MPIKVTMIFPGAMAHAAPPRLINPGRTWRYTSCHGASLGVASPVAAPKKKPVAKKKVAPKKKSKR